MGVMINSRYGKHHELELMCRIIAALPPNVRSEIKLFWCDSKATCSYSAIVKRPLNAQTYEMVGREIHDAACSFGGDHNGIDVGYSCEDDALWGDDGHRYSVHPHWNGDASCG
jgi:hypothetical protein